MKKHTKMSFLLICIILVTVLFNIKSEPLEALNEELSIVTELPSPIDTPLMSSEEAVMTSVDSHAVTTDIPTARQNELAAFAPNADVDLSISKSVSSPTGNPGELITYTLSYANNGTNLATNVIITDDIPSEIEVWSVNATPPITDTGATPAYVWQLPDLAPGVTGTITIAGVVAATSGTFTNTATIATADIDINISNNSSTIPFSIYEATFSAIAYGAGGANDDSINGIVQTSDGGYIAVGYTSTDALGWKSIGWALKIDSEGNIVWQKTYGDTGPDSLNSIQPTNDGNYIIAGETSSYGGGGSDAWIMKIDGFGNLIWQKTYGTADGNEIAYSVRQADDGGYIFSGVFSISNKPYTWVVKLDAAGEITWQHRLSEMYLSGKNDIVPTVSGDANGDGYIVVGNYQRCSSSACNIEVMFAKFDNNGVLRWHNAFVDSSDRGPTDSFRSIEQTSDGGYIIAGEVNYSFTILKITVWGTLDWRKIIDLPSTGGAAYSVQQTSDGGYVVAGKKDKKMMVVKLDSDGNSIWQKQYIPNGYYEDENIAYSIQQTSDGGYVVAGSTNFGERSGTNGWILKLDSNGSLGSSCSAIESSINLSVRDYWYNGRTPWDEGSASGITSLSAAVPVDSFIVPSLSCGGPPSLNFSKIADDTTPNAGERITYTLTIANTGTNATTSMSMIDSLPAGQMLAGPITISPSDAGVVGNASTLPVIAHSLSVDASANIVVTLPVTVTVGGAQENTAEAFSFGMSAAENAAQSITVNAFPTGSSNNVLLNEDSDHTFAAPEFPYNDLENDIMAGVKITVLPIKGNLTCNSAPVVAGGDCTVTNLVFTPAPDGNGTAYTTFNFRVKAATGAPYSGDVYTMTLNVNPSSDPPVGANDIISVTEDIDYTFQASDISFYDVDGDISDGIQILSEESAGDLEYAGVDVVAGTGYSDVTQLVFKSPLNDFGSPYAVLNFKVKDSSGAFSAATYQMTINVLNVPDFPTGGDESVTTVEDTLYTFQATDFTFADVDNDTFAGLELATLETAGDLIYGGSSVTVGAVYTDVTQLTFAPALNGNGSPYATFGFYIHDSNGMTSTVSYTMTVNVTPVNDLPTGGDGTVAATEDIPYTFSASDFPYDDPVEGDAFGGIRFTSFETAGDLECNGTDVSVGLECTTITQLVFTPASDENGSAYATFQFRTMDDGGAVSTAAYTMTVNVAPVADVPVGVSATVTTTEDVPYAFTAADFPINDPDGDTLYGVQITALETAGDLTYGGQDVALDGVYTDTTQLLFTPLLDENGSSYDTFQFKLIDTTLLTSTASYVMTINVTAVSDLPTSADAAVNGTEDIPYSFVASDFPFSDGDNDTLDYVVITSLETVGDLECQGVNVIILDACLPGDLVYNPPLDGSGSPLASFEFKVRDSSDADSAAAYTMSINIAAAPENPLGGDGLVTVAQNGSYNFTTSDFAYYDGDGDALNGINLLTLPLAGTFTHNGQPIAATGLYTDVNQFVFTPDAGDTGSPYADFTFQLQDATGALSIDSYSMSINVQSGDPPASGNGVVMATEDIRYTFAITDFVYSDPNDDPLTGIWFVSAETSGNLQCNNAEILVGSVCDDVFSLTFDPDANDFGSPAASFNFRVRDAAGFLSDDTYTMEINVAAVNDVPVLYSTPLLTATQDIPYIYNIVGADNDIVASLTISNISNFNIPAWLTLTDNGDGTGTLSGTPSNDDVGMYNMNLELSDETGDSDNQEFFLTVLNVNDAPVFTSTAPITAAENAFYAYNITVADIDAYDPVAITTVSPLPEWLTLGDRGDGTGTLTGRPNNAEVGNYNISLRVSDMAGAANLQNFTLTVENVNEAPAFTSVPVGAAAQEQLYQYAITAVDHDPNELLTFTLPNGPSWLTLIDNGDGTADLNGTPTFNDAGAYPVALQIADRESLTVTQTYTLTVLNASPTAVEDYASTPINTPVTLNVRANDSDANGNAITVIAVSQPYTGTTELLNAAQLRYTPPANFTGEVVFTYTVSDGANSAVGYAFVDVFSSPPVGVNDVGETISGFPVTLDVLNNDFDPDGEKLMITAVDQTSISGSVLIAADGQTLTYRPPAAFTGDAVFGYTLQVVGDADQWETAVVTITVRDINSISSDVSVTRSSTPLTFPEGEARVIRSEIHVTNNNQTAIAAGVVLIDTINTTVLSGGSTSSRGSCLLSSNGTTCNLGIIPPGQTVLVNLDYAIGTETGLSITSTISSQTVDPDSSNNTDNTLFTVQAGRSTRMAGLVNITADSFVFVPATGNTRGIGNVLIGEHFFLSGIADTVEFNTEDIAVIAGTLTYVSGDQDIVRGIFDADNFGNLQFTQVDEIFLHKIGGFAIDTPSFTSLNLLNGKAAGLVNLNIPAFAGKADVSGNIPTTFAMFPGPYVNGQTLPFTVPYFNPSGDMLKIADIKTTMIRQSDEYYLVGSGQLHLNLPGNALTGDVPYLVLADDGNFTGRADSIPLAIEGAESFTLVRPEFDNNGFRDVSQSLFKISTDVHTFWDNTEIASYGFNQTGKIFSMPDIVYDILSIGQVNGRIKETATAYQMEKILNGELRLRLPQNHYSIPNFDITSNANNADIMLNVGEAQLILHDPYLDGGTLVARSVTWKLPYDMGGGIETFNQSVRLDSNDLNSVPFPAHIKLGGIDGRDTDVVSVNIQETNAAYQIDLEIMMHIDLPGVPPEGLPGTASGGPEGIEAALEPFTFIVAGYEVSAGGANINFDDLTLQIEEAVVAYAKEQAEQEGIGLLMELLGVDEDTVQIADGRARFKLPDICLGESKENDEGEEECKGGAELKDLQADLVINDDSTYDISAQGAMEWPSDEKAPLPGGCSGIEASISVSYDPNTGRQIFTMIPNGSGGTVRMVDAQGNSTTVPFTETSLNRPIYLNGQSIPETRQISGLPDGFPFGPPGLLLTGAYFALDGCEIPLIDATGPVFVSKLGGGFEFDDGGIILRLSLGFDIKRKGQDPSPLTINTDSRFFLPKRWIKFSGGCMNKYSIDPWDAEQELDENFSDVEIELTRSDSCYGTYKFTRMEEGDTGTLVYGTGSSGAPSSITISSRFDKHPWFVRADGDFIYNEEITFATGLLEVDPRGVRMELTSGDDIRQYFELEFTGGVSAWVDRSDEFWLTGFLQASFRITLEQLWDVLPDSGMDFTAQIEFGHFIVNGTGKILGFKGTAAGEVEWSIWSKSFSVGFFLDENFNIATGDSIDNYQLATRYRAQRAYTTMLLSSGKLASNQTLSALRLTADPDLTFVLGEKLAGNNAIHAPVQELLVDFAVPYETTTHVTLQGQAGGPTMTLEGPDGTIYDYDSLPATITYTEYMTYTNPAGQTTAAQQGMGQLRISHAVADYGTMDVLVDDVRLFTGLTFTDTTPYQSFAPGSHVVKIVAAGTTSVLAQATVTLDSGKDATVIATGQAGSIQAWAVEDDNSPRAGGRPYIRLLHAGSPSTSVDLVQRMGREYYIDIAYQGIGDYIKLYPMGYTFDVRSHSDQVLLATLENEHLENGSIYTLFLFDGIDGTVGTLIQDAAAPAQLQIVHVAGDIGTLEVSLDGTLITDTLNLGTGTTLAVLPLGSHQIVISDSGSILISETVTLDQVVPYAYVVESPDGITAGRLISNDQLASYGFVNARLLHLAPSVPNVDVTISYGLGNETPLFSDVGFDELSGQFNVRERITATIVMRQAGTPNVLHTFNNVPLPVGDVLTLYLYEQGGVPKLAAVTDASMAIKTTSMYTLEPAAAGDWAVHLHGDVIDGNDYKLLVEGDKPDPIVQDVEIVDVGGQPTLQWRLTSPLPETTVGLYYKSGPITETEVISQDGSLVTNMVEVYNGHTFTGTLSAPSDPGWTDGTVQQYPIDLSILQNGSYSIYLTADDLDGGLTRAAALDPLVVSHTWPTTWNASLIIANEAYREVRADWTRFPNPEVEQYKLIGISESGLRQETRLGGNGFTPYQTIGNLTPGETYTFTVQAWDGEDLGRVTASEPVSFVVPGATFTVTGATNLAVDAGQIVTTTITLYTDLDPYPAFVGLSAGAGSDGMAMSFSENVVVPTLTGTSVEVYLRTSEYLPGDVYTATVKAYGGGETVLFELQPDVIAPYFDLTAVPNTPMTITEGDSLAMTIGATRYEEHTDEIWFTVQDLPLVDWMVDTVVLSGTAEATLTITDTTLLQHGTYTFTLYAEDSRTSSTITRTLIVNKPTYTLNAAVDTITVTTGITQTTQVSLTLDVQGSWDSLVTLMLDPKMSPPFGRAGFGAAMEAFVETSAPNEIILWIETLPQTPIGTYLLPIVAESDGRQEQVNLFLTVGMGNMAPVGIGDTYTATEEVTLNESTPGVLWNDVDPDSQSPLTSLLDTTVTSGTLALASDGSFVYTPTLNFCGTDSFTYRANDGTDDSNIANVTLNVTCVNDAPIANDDAYATLEDIPLVVAATGIINNDIEFDDDTLSVIVNSDVSSGTLNLNLDGSFVYTPSLNFYGEDGFTYILGDGVLTDTAVVTITVTAVNDAPIANAGDNQSVLPGSITTLDGTGSSDVDDDTLIYNWTQIGGESITLSNNSTVTPTFTTPSASGVLTFSLTVTDSSGLSDNDIVTVSFYMTFLPVAMNNYSYQPDLIVEAITITADSLAVVVRNVGNSPVSNSFWVDMYINSDTPPTGVNQTWESNGGEGLAWGVPTLFIAPGESLTLTLSSPYYSAGASNFSGTIAAGSEVYVQVDSVGLSFGNVNELNEDNNINGPLMTTVPSIPSN